MEAECAQDVRAGGGRSFCRQGLLVLPPHQKPGDAGLQQKVGHSGLLVHTCSSLPGPSHLGRKWVGGRTRTGIPHFLSSLWGQTLSVSFNHKAS